jgi:hypothetical protein
MFRKPSCIAFAHLPKTKALIPPSNSETVGFEEATINPTW